MLEIVADDAGGTWRAVYTAEFANAVYMRHVFQKKPTKGIATPQRHIDLIVPRLREARQCAKRDHE